jgi:large subunit ribosomal protein L29
MKYSELKLKTKKELLEELYKLKREQLNLRFQKAAGEAIKGSRVNAIRKTVAKIKTLLTELKLAGGSSNA